MYENVDSETVETFLSICSHKYGHMLATESLAFPIHNYYKYVTVTASWLWLVSIWIILISQFGDLWQLNFIYDYKLCICYTHIWNWPILEVGKVAIWVEHTHFTTFIVDMK